jgi:parallel beta-helix repeat protein
MFEYGIWLDSSNYNSISGNTVTQNNHYGIKLRNSSNNSVSGNTITNNQKGILFDASSNNKFCHNNFIDNSQQVDIWSSGFANVWDDGYPSGGNYWSDHVCTSNPSDGSQPYVIDTNNIDHYPFQDPNGWLLPPVITVLSPENKTYSTSSVPLTFTLNELTSGLDIAWTIRRM